MKKECVKCGKETLNHYYEEYSNLDTYSYCMCEGSSILNIYCCLICSKGNILKIPSHIPEKQYRKFIEVYLKGEN